MNILQILAADKEILLYRKELNKITKKVTATILLQQMIYWHSKMGGPFFKFIVRSENNKFYKEGDSWCEELGFSVKEFGTAYKTLENLGVVKKDTNMSRVATYSLQINILEELLNRIYVNAETAVTQTREGGLPSAETAVTQTPKGELDITETTSEITNTPLTPKGGPGERKKRQKTMTLEEISNFHGFTVPTIEDFIKFRVGSGGIDTPEAFRKYLIRELSFQNSQESIKLGDWFEAWAEERATIEELRQEFLSIQPSWFNRHGCRERGRDGFAYGLFQLTGYYVEVLEKEENVQTILIEIAYQLAQQARAVEYITFLHNKKSNDNVTLVVEDDF